MTPASDGERFPGRRVLLYEQEGEDSPFRPSLELRPWGDGAPALEDIEVPILFLPFDSKLIALDDLQAYGVAPWLGALNTGHKLAVEASYRAEVEGASVGLGSDHLFLVERTNPGRLTGKDSDPEDQFWNFLFDILAQLAETMPFVTLRVEDWPLDNRKAASIDAALQQLLAKGQQVAFCGATDNDALEPYGFPLDRGLPESLPSLSIIMPVFDAERFLPDALESILSQSFRDFELVCVDDGSTDRSLEILQTAASKDPRVRVFSQPNAGVSATRNRGLDLSCGAFVTFADADDRLFPDSLSRRMELLEHKGALVCGGRAAFLDEEGQDLGMCYGRVTPASYQHALSVPFHISTLMGYRSVMKRARFPDGIAHAEDWSYIVELLRAGYSIESAGEAPLVGYRWHSASATASNRDAHFEGCLDFLDSLTELAANKVGATHQNQVRLTEIKISRAKAQRLQAHFVFLVLLGDRNALERLLAREDFDRLTLRSKWLNQTFFDIIAVRAFRLPQHSRALDQAICEQLDDALEACRRLPNSAGNRELSVAFRRYLLACQKRASKSVDLAAPSLSQLLSLKRDEIILALHRSLRPLRHWIRSGRNKRA